MALLALVSEMHKYAASFRDAWIFTFPRKGQNILPFRHHNFKHKTIYGVVTQSVFKYIFVLVCDITMLFV